MSRRASETPSSGFLRISNLPQLPQQPRFSRGVQPIVIHNKSNSTINLSSVSDNKPSRSLFKNLKRFTHRSKPSNTNNLEISSPLLVHHKTAEELISSLESSSPEVLPFIRSERLSKIKILSSTELSETNNRKEYNSEIPIISIATNDSSNSEISPKTSLEISPKISKTIPAQNAAKIILNALPPPPPVPKLPQPPSKNPRRLTTAEEKRPSALKNLEQTKQNNRYRASDMSNLSSRQTKTLHKPSSDSQTKNSFLNPDVDDMPLQIILQFTDNDLNSPLSDSVCSELTDDQTTPTISPLTTPIIPPKASCRNSSLPPLSPKRANKVSAEFNALPQDGLAFPSRDKLSLPLNSTKSSMDQNFEELSIIRALQAQNALLSQELDYTKRLLAKEVQERARIKSSLPKTNIKSDRVFSQAC